jgi:hypothetical protein
MLLFLMYSFSSKGFTPISNFVYSDLGSSLVNLSDLNLRISGNSIIAVIRALLRLPLMRYALYFWYARVSFGVSLFGFNGQPRFSSRLQQ